MTCVTHELWAFVFPLVECLFVIPLLVVVAAADVEASTSSSLSDSVKSSPPPQSGAGKSNSSSQPQSNLPPRLQRKQRQAEEENYMKYYKPMDYMRQNNSYHRKTNAAASASSRQRGAESGRQNGTAAAHHVADVNSRGSVGNRKLWTDNLTSVSNGRCGNGVDDDGSDVRFGCPRSSATGDTRHADGEQKHAPVVVLTSSSNKLTSSLEADVASLNIQSTAPSYMTSQLSHAQPVSLSLWFEAWFEVSGL